MSVAFGALQAASGSFALGRASENVGPRTVPRPRDRHRRLGPTPRYELSCRLDREAGPKWEARAARNLAPRRRKPEPTSVGGHPVSASVGLLRRPLSGVAFFSRRLTFE